MLIKLKVGPKSRGSFHRHEALSCNRNCKLTDPIGISSDSSLGITIHLSTWRLVADVLEFNLRFGPVSRAFLHDLRKYWEPYPSNPSLDLCNALSAVCVALRVQQTSENPLMHAQVYLMRNV